MSCNLEFRLLFPKQNLHQGRILSIFDTLLFLVSTFDNQFASVLILFEDAAVLLEFNER